MLTKKLVTFRFASFFSRNQVKSPKLLEMFILQSLVTTNY